VGSLTVLRGAEWWVRLPVGQEEGESSA